MQGLHHHQQQLAALLAAALADDRDSTSSSPPPIPPSSSSSSSVTTTTQTTAAAPPATIINSSETGAGETEKGGGDSARLAALNSLHRAITYPPNSLLVAHSAAFLSPGLSQLLSDKSYSVRQAAATAYGALCAVVCSIPIGSSGRQNHVMLGSLVDRFINWALPLLSNNVSARDGSAELALEGLREFLSIGDVIGIERYAMPILKACQELLEDERTSMSLLQRLLSVLSLVSLKFTRLFHPHFLDIVDMLLGWALVPDLGESDRRVIMDSFLQFQKHWVDYLDFSLGLLSKFLGDMEVLLQDGNQATTQHFHGLLALLSCFSTILRSTASGLLEKNMLDQISDSISKMIPRLLGCLSMVGRRFGWSNWIEDLWKCLTLLAEILGEKFSTFYPLSLDILFQTLELDSTVKLIGGEKINSIQVHGTLKTNLQLLSLQRLGLLPSCVQKILNLDSPISQSRLHPSRLVTAGSAATYIFLLEHGNDEIVQQAMTSLMDELELLKGILGEKLDDGDRGNHITVCRSYSGLELSALIKFDLKVLLTCVSLAGKANLDSLLTLSLKRSDELVSFISKKLDPFDSPIDACLELQVNVINTLERLAAVDFLSQWSLRNQSHDKAHVDAAGGKVLQDNSLGYALSTVVVEHLIKYSSVLVNALKFSSPLAVKLLSLGWVQRFCENLIIIYENANRDVSFHETSVYIGNISNVALSILDAAFDREPKVRTRAALVLELLLQARLVHPVHFYPIAEVVLEKLGDPDVGMKNVFVRLLSQVLPATIYACGLQDKQESVAFRPGVCILGNDSNLHWKRVFALKQLDQQFHSQQLVSVLSYISQRWKAPLSSWIQRLVLGFRGSKDNGLSQLEEMGNFGAHSGWLDIKADKTSLERICTVNNLAGAWWALHEAARYCIATRLRTNFGGPAQTFAALERMLLDIAHVLQLDNEHTDGILNIIGSSGAHLLPMRLLLDFVEALKKNVYNAYEGSAVLPAAPRQSVSFFRANKKVCEEWFSRICEPMMNAGLALQSHDATYEYCTLRLEELKGAGNAALKDKSRAHVADNIHNIRVRLSMDVSRILLLMALALCKNHEAEALLGLQKWVSMTFSHLLVDGNHSLEQSEISGPFSWMTGLVYQAEGRYEKAAAYFTHLLQDEDSLSSMGSDGVQFAIARVIESYTAVSDWKSLDSWLSELQALRSRHVGKSFSGALTTAGNEINAIQALAHFDEGDLQAAWACLDLTPKSSSELTLDPKLALQRSEQMLLQALLFQAEGNSEKVPQCLQNAKSMLDEILSVLPLDGLAEAASYAIQLHCIFAFEESHQLRDGKAKNKLGQSILSSCIQFLQPLIKGVHQDCSAWLKVLRVYRTISPSSQITLKLGMDLLRLARKQGNTLLANRLKNYLSDHVSSSSDARSCDFLTSYLQYQGILLMHAENKFEDAFMNLWSFMRRSLVTSASEAPCADVSVLKAKACLKLSNWLRRDYPGLNLEDIVLKMSEDFSSADTSCTQRSEPSFMGESLNSKPGVGVLIEEMIGTATKSSSMLCSAFGKSWISFASWCFHQATNSLLNPHKNVLRSCFFSSLLVQELKPDRFNFTENEIKCVESAILPLFQNEVDAKDLDSTGEERHSRIDSEENVEAKNNREALVLQVVGIMEAVAGVPGAENPGSLSLSVTLTSQLIASLRSANKDVEETDLMPIVDKLVGIWWSLRKRRVSLFGDAALGYMRYLCYASTNPYNAKLSGAEYDLPKQKTGSNTLRATLYVLHILLNYGLELKDVLEPALSTVSLLAWQEVTPQLFARLSSHPEEVVRKQLEGVLMMLAKSSPWSIVYPTLVDVNASDEKPSEELLHIQACLSELYPRLIQDVQLMINELGNVTVLWEELWLSTLQDLHMDVIRRVNLLKEEAARIAENVTLSQSEKKMINAAKYSAMMAPIVVALERRFASTSRKPGTPHEIWFHQEYRERLKSAILAFKTPPASAAVLGDVWRPFDNIAASLASYQRKSSISLKEVAPCLALLTSSDVPMPGLEKQVPLSESDTCLTTSLQGIVTISSFSDEVTIIATKTRPKKLAILGSDGKRYTYLLKGREDLRLDARIMQLLQAVNGFLYSSLATCRSSVGIRYYSVTPISGRAGLIQWVNNVISLYSVFKSWQTRIQLAQLSALATDNTKDSAPPPVPRPSDMFYGKIIPALKEKGIRKVISRRDWPHDVKRKVLLDLMNEVPKQLLHQELWCASEGFKAFSSKLKRYSGSVAAMSIVGHILGLGDRHLDNILMDFCSGDVVHIDYNVCFDKGQRLKVPEIVPFRLTQTMEAALGLTGVEGTFRANCEAVLGVLRENKDILLMLLEVFVWDPLVEWTRGDFHDDAAIGGEERKGMELAVSLSLFASRVQEIRVPLQEHHDLLLATLPAVESTLERFAEVLNHYELASALFYRADQERSKLIMHETSAKTIVAEAACNSEKTRASFEIQAREFAQAKAIVSEKAQETTTWMEQHGRVLDALRKNLIPEITASIKLKGIVDALSLTSAVLVAGVPLTVVPEPTQAQCYDIDREVSQLISELDNSLSSALTALQVYSLALQRVLPLNYHTTSPVFGWAQALQLSAHALSSEVLSLARGQAGELIAKLCGDNLDSIRNRYNDLCLKIHKYTADIKKTEEDCTELVNSIGSEAESKLKDRLLSGFITYMQSSGLLRKENAGSSHKSGQARYDVTKGSKLEDPEEKKEKALAVLQLAVSSMYDQVKHKVDDIFRDSIGGREGSIRSQSDLGPLISEFEEQVEKCLLLAGFLENLKRFFGWEVSGSDAGMNYPTYHSEGNCATIFQRSLLSCKDLVSQLTEFVLPDVMKTCLLFSSEVMDAFGLVSQIRGSIDMALEQLMEIKVERESLVELERNYVAKVGLITERQLALEEAAVKGREHLSWEEAEELASQEEACRSQLDQLHQAWNQREFRNSSLIKREAEIKNALVSAEHQFQSLISAEELTEPADRGSKGLLAKLVTSFSELESLDRILFSLGGSPPSNSNWVPSLGTIISSGHALSEHIWSFGCLLNNHSFFIWKIGIIDSFLDSCVHDATSSVDQNLGYEQLIGVVKKKLEIHLQERIGCYLKERVAPAFCSWLEKENEHLKQLSEETKEFMAEQTKRGFSIVKGVQQMLEEYCNAHETARAAKSAASRMKRQVNELREGLRMTSLEILQMEWMHDSTLTLSQNARSMCQRFLASDDNLHSIILNFRRPTLLETMQSAISEIARSIEGLQACERNSLTAEGQLERAMGWACGGHNSGTAGHASAKSSGIPPEFHDHLMRRRQLLWESREKASSTVSVCMSVLEFEASRDGIFQSPDEAYAPRSSSDGRMWQQAYLNALTKLELAFHSFTCTEQQWKLAQSTMDAASNGLFSATNELCIASLKAKSASGDLQSTVLAMRDRAYEASVALSAFACLSMSHTALTSETGSMLEEVLAITEDLHDVHSLGKEAAGLHHSLMEDLSKASAILIPFESLLSKDVAAMNETMTREKETKAEVSPIHGQAIYQSYWARTREACQNLKPLVPSILHSVKGLYSILGRLARTASLHAGNLNKALEGPGESEEAKSQGSSFSRADLTDDGPELDDQGEESLSRSDSGSNKEVLSMAGLSLEDRGWISPPDSIYSSGSEFESGVTSREASGPDNFINSAVMLEELSSDQEEAKAFQNSLPSSQPDTLNISDSGKPASMHVATKSSNNRRSTSNEPNENLKAISQKRDEFPESSQSLSERLELKSGEEAEVSYGNKDKAEVESHETSLPQTNIHKRVGRGKNAYALSVLRRIEMKLDGRDIADEREISIAEQVDHLIKQATSIDNLCNMYEGWTPWI